MLHHFISETIKIMHMISCASIKMCPLPFFVQAKCSGMKIESLLCVAVENPEHFEA